MLSSCGALTGYEKNGQTFVNLCLHDIRVQSKDGIVTIPQSGVVARGKRNQNDIEEFAGIAITRSVYSEVYGMPDKLKGVIYIVSAEVLNILNDSRSDVVCPGRTHKDAFGNQSYTESFRRQF